MLFTKLGRSEWLAWCVFFKCEFLRPGAQEARISGGQGFRRPRIGREAFRWWPGVDQEFRRPGGGPEWTRSPGGGQGSARSSGFGPGGC